MALTTRVFPETIFGEELFQHIAARPETHRLSPEIAAFFRRHLSVEKAVRFRDAVVISSHFPPIPSPAWTRFMAQLTAPGGGIALLHSVTWAVTNRCGLRCWHCYNADRDQRDVPLATIRDVAESVRSLGAVMVHLTGGEPLLRGDLESIAALFDESVCLSVGTAGLGLTPARARSLADAGVFALGVSLDSEVEAEHDVKRGAPGAFRAALDGLAMAAEAGLYPYVVAVASHGLLSEERFPALMRLARDAGALEVHLLEPCPVGRIAGREDAMLSAEDRARILEWRDAVARDPGLPILSTFAHLESPESFGCGAGNTHLYIDGSGEVCPCQLVPLAFGNIRSDPFPEILARMGRRFNTPRPHCVGFDLRAHIPSGGRFPTAPEVSEHLCDAHLPAEHPLPAFFRIRQSEILPEVGAEDLRSVYNDVHSDYDAHWLSEAAGPIHDLVERIPWPRGARVFEAGCGTGFCTALVAMRLGPGAHVVAADISEGMMSLARSRLAQRCLDGVEFILSDAIEALERSGPFDVIISSWVLGYIPLAPFFAAAARSLVAGGHLGFAVHRDNSPREPLEIFRTLAAESPGAIERAVNFDFPLGIDDVSTRLATAGLQVRETWEGAISFACADAEAAMRHLMRSGAGTAYLEAVSPTRRDELSARFIAELAQRHAGGPVDVVHDYVAAVAVKRGG